MLPMTPRSLPSLAPLLAIPTGALVLVASTEVQAQRRGAGGFLKSGTVGTRLGLGAFLIREVTTDGEGEVVDEDTSLGLSLLGGLGYALHPRIALDFDLELHFGFEPQMELLQVEMTPAARLFLMPKLYGRAAYAVRLKDPTNQLFTLGGGYFLSRGSLSVYLELNVVVTSEKEVNTPFIPRIGLEVAF